MMCVIVNHGHGSKVVNMAKKYGVVGGKIMHGTEQPTAEFSIT